MDLFERFLQQEKAYLQGLSPETLRFYRDARRTFGGILAQPTEQGMLACIKTQLAGVFPAAEATADCAALRV